MQTRVYPYVTEVNARANACVFRLADRSGAGLHAVYSNRTSEIPVTSREAVSYKLILLVFTGGMRYT